MAPKTGTETTKPKSITKSQLNGILSSVKCHVQETKEKFTSIMKKELKKDLTLYSKDQQKA